MTMPPPLFRDQRKVDADHLQILVICHYVGAGLSIVGMGFIALHYAIMRTVFANPKTWANVQNGPPPAAFFALFKWFYLFGGVFLIACLVVNIVSAVCISRHRHRIFSLVVAGLNCVHIPLGTLLGVFTMVTLLRDSVREVYDAREQ